ncbi:Maf family protein [Microaerobacter geothermalis]|uniref:Maf family protein n=1 Tax=Microaerobacter geothermalis TaxID=674972 RepID=UPI001F245AAD|nr:Maf family protein [Microaerobacter geothermalis]MCF6092704.1 Maf family protein [Microaerobacter geothermalis]
MTEPLRKIILASSSPRRKELLGNLGLQFEVEASDADETISDFLSPSENVMELALRKAKAVSQWKREGIIIGADTIVVLENEILGKPRDQEDAFSMLTRLQGRIHVVYSGVALIDMDNQKEVKGFQSTKVHMVPLGSEEIKRYVATGEPMDKAGSYAIQGMGATLIDWIEGCYFNVVGLPLAFLREELKKLGIRIL